MGTLSTRRSCKPMEGLWMLATWRSRFPQGKKYSHNKNDSMHRKGKPNDTLSPYFGRNNQRDYSSRFTPYQTIVSTATTRDRQIGLGIQHLFIAKVGDQTYKCQQPLRTFPHWPPFQMVTMSLGPRRMPEDQHTRHHQQLGGKD